ncbi:MAG: helix-turn-helix transcriptional regulator [Bacteroidetes bacterium]|nr:helix-turn-helix transcriptional regulator [Bacteroidota bacterium]
MEERKHSTPPLLNRLSKQFGQNLKQARLRRKLSAAQVAERAGMSRSTLWQIEKGAPGVSLGSYMQVMLVLNLENDIALLAANDELGRKLQDAELSIAGKNGRRRK